MSDQGGTEPTWLRTEIERLQGQLEALSRSVANQQSVFVDIAGARTAELHASLSQIEGLSSELRGETHRLRELQDAIAHHLHDLVLDVVQPELRAQLSQGMPQLVAEAMAPELRRALSDWLPEIVARNVSPEVRQLLSEWLPVMVADTVQPEVHRAIADRLPDVTASAVQPEIRRVLAERLPHLVAETVQPELYRALVERLPAMVDGAVTPQLRDALLSVLPDLVSDTVQPEVRGALDERLPGIVGQVVTPEVRRVLAEQLPRLVAETVQPELRQTLADRLPHLVAETVRPEVRDTLHDRLPSVVAEVVTPEVRRTLAERLPTLVAETVQPELRQTLADRLPGIVAEVVSPAVGALLAERVPGMLAEAVTPELSVTLAEMEGAAAELRHEAAKLRSLRDVVAERLPETVISAVQPHLQDVLTVRLPLLVGELVEPVVRSVLTDQLPAMVAAAVQPDISQRLAERVPELVADTVRPELRQTVIQALEERLPGVVAEAVRPELRLRLGQLLPSVIGEGVTPEVLSLITARLPTLVGEAVTPDLSVSLAEVEGCAAEMRAETARIRGLREVISERLPDAVMSAVRTVLDDTVTTRLPELLGRLVQPAVAEAVATPLPAALGELLEPALGRVLARELPAVIGQTLEREIQRGLGESLPDLVAAATEPSLRAALAGVESSVGGIGQLRQEMLDRLGELTQEAAAAPFAHFESSSAQLRAEAERLGDLREEVLRKLPALVEEAVAVPLAEFEASAAQLRLEAERLRTLRQELTTQLSSMVLDAVETAKPGTGGPAPIDLADLPGMVQDAVAVSLTEVEASARQLRADALELRDVQAALAQQLPSLVQEAMSSALAALPQASAAGPAPATPQAGGEPAAPDPPSSPGGPKPEAGSPNPEGPVAPSPAGTAARRPEAETVETVETVDVEPALWESSPVPEGRASTTTEATTSARPLADEARAPDPPPVDPSLAAALAPPLPNGARTADVVASPPAATAGDEAGVACVLPGVVVGPTLARGVGEAINRARLRRRRRRRAGPPSAGLHRRDPYTGELARRLEWFALARRQGANGVKAHDDAAPGTIPVGERDGREVSVPIGQNGGVCLTGPRAREVARALVLTFLAGNGSDAARAVLVGDLFPGSTTFPGLARVRDVGSVLAGLQAEAARRQALFAEARVEDIAAYQAHRPDDPLPLVLVAAAEMTTPEADRLGALLGEGGRVGIIGVLVDAPHDGLLTLQLQGSARVAGIRPETAADGLAGARLFTVERDPAAELLDVLASARTDVEGEPVAEPPDEPFEAVIPSSAAIHVRLLGTYRIDVHGREIRAGLRAKARELLAFYLLHPEGTTLEEATEALWPEADPRRGSEWFWTALGNLRSRLRSATENTDLKVIEREGDRYRVEPLFEVDLWRFEAALSSAGASSADPSWATTLEAAASLYGGELLAGAEWPWSEVPREDLRGRAVDVLVSLAATRLVGGDVRGALEALERAVEIDPLAEQLYRRIMRLHAKLGHPDQAAATFRGLEARLGQFDLQPSPETVKLQEELCRPS